MGAWDSPPTEAEKKAAWASPPTPEEVASASPPAPRTPQDPGALGAAGEGFQNSATLGLSDEIMGAIQASLPVPGDKATWIERYVRERNAKRQAQADASTTQPWAYRGGQVAGGITSGIAASPLLPAAAPAGAGAFTRFAAGAANAAPLGAVYGAGESTSDTMGGVALDALSGGVISGLTGGSVAVAAPVISQWLKDKSIEYGRKALSGISTPMSATRKPIPSAAVDAAYDAGAIKPWNTVSGIADKLEIAADKQSGIYNDLISRLEAAGVDGPSAHQIAARLQARAGVERPVTWQKMDPLVGDLEDTATEALTKSDPGKTYTHGYNPPLSLSQTRALVGNAQRSASSEYAKIPNKVSMAGDSKMAVAGELRQAMEDAVQAQASKAPAEAAAFLPEKERLANLLWALQEAREGAGKAARRGPLGFTDIVAGTAAATVGGGPALAGTLATTKIVMPRVSAATGYFSRLGSKALAGLSGEAPAAMGGALPATSAEAPALSAYLSGRLGRPALFPAGAEDQAASTPGSAGQQTPGSSTSDGPWGSAPPARFLTDLGASVKANPGSFGQYAAPLSEAAQRGDNAVGVAHKSLWDHDPAYREMIRKLMAAGQ